MKRSRQELFEYACTSVGPGWGSLVKRLIDDLLALGWDGYLSQVKEKLGGMRFYIGVATDAVHARVDQAEQESFHICEQCGAKGRVRYHPWLLTLCEACEKIRHPDMPENKDLAPTFLSVKYLVPTDPPTTKGPRS